ncbi:MAG: AbrB/MazE/SpoVT family DNA-binding domain-containing protein [Candidatus Saccharibacteria bacterium]|nr:AbrB/MazE/SpoVT family DNA-binding domain-containing protein [Candidatus Saccharibacteria bacterium]
MGVRTSEEQHIRSIMQNNSGSYTVSLPIAMVRKLRWQRRQKVTVTLKGDKLVIEDWKD